MRRSFGEGEEGSADATAETARAGVEETSGPRAGFARRAIVGDLHLQEGHSGPLRQMSIGKLGDADSRLIRRDPIFTRSTSVHTAIAAQIISVLLKPRTWKPPPAGEIFEFSPHELVELCEHAEAVLREEPTLLKLSAPIKIFGDIHGQYPDLMRLFSEFGAPSHTGDLDLVDYLFLGDFVDRGTYQLETICLILALKIEYRDRVFVIRGNHESPEINEKYGFRDECIERLGPAGDAVWRCFNAVFAWMPLAATIGGKIFCVHGGIGLTVESLEQVAAIERPIQKGEGPLMMDLLWSDPAAHDSVTGISLNLQRLGPDRTPDRAPMPGECTTFDAARVNDFCRHNGIHLIIRAHECVMDGFERFASGRLVTVFSASRYCNTYENAGAILLVDRSLTVIPKLLKPSAATHYGWHDNYSERPPTPPRGRQVAPAGGDGSGLDDDDLDVGVGAPITLRNMPSAANDDATDAGALDSMRGLLRGLPATLRRPQSGGPSAEGRRNSRGSRGSRSPTR